MFTTKKGAGALALLAAAVLVLAGIWLIFAQDGTAAGEKTITVTVQPEGGSYTITTDALYLRQALEEADLIAGEEGPYGLYVTTVEGRTADESKNEYWMLTQNGRQTATGVDTTPIADGDRFELTLTTFG